LPKRTPAPPPDPALVTITEAGRILASSRSTVYRLVRQGDLEVVRIGTRPRVTLRSIAAYVDRQARTLGD